MENRVNQVEFAKLRHAYVTIKSFLEKETFTKVKSLNTKLAADMKLVGDDNYELLTKFVEKFELEHQGFDYEKHFYSEYELFGTPAALHNLFALSVRLPLRTIELLTFDKLKFDKPEFFSPQRSTKDLTFKDLLTWYIEGHFVTAEDVKYELKKEKNDTQHRL